MELVFYENDRSIIYLNTFDLWGIAAIDDTFIYTGKLSLIF